MEALILWFRRAAADGHPVPTDAEIAAIATEPNTWDSGTVSDVVDALRAVEEILAELTAAFTCASLGIDHDLKADSTAYIGFWLRVLAQDKRFIFVAAAHAQRACDWLWSLQPDAVPLDSSADTALP